MEPPQHHHQADQESGNNNNKSGSGGYTCRQTSTRWTPTTEQIRILKDLYYNGGVRSPAADQIQLISARLRQYGKIEGKNVFYWFQNHKARERQKKRFNGTTIMNTPPSSSSPNLVMTASDHYHHPLLNHHHGHVPMQRPASLNVKLDQENHLLQQNRSYPTFNNGNLNHASSGSECGAVNALNGSNDMSSHIYGSMEQNYSMSYNNVGGGWTNTNHNDHQYYSSPPYNFFDRPKSLFGSEGHQEYGGDAYLEHRRTLPLFPMRGDDHINGGGDCIWKSAQSDGCDPNDPCGSLKLCLNSYNGGAPN